MRDDELYRYASGVDIHNNYQDNEEKRAIGYDGEYRIFCSLLTTHFGENIKFLMNVEVPVNDTGTSTEIDCLMICKAGLVSFEIKNYEGTIFGKPEEKKWTQHFRTTGNYTFHNPLKQNQYHIQALKRLYPTIPCYSVVVFTNRSCDITRVELFARETPICMEFCIRGEDLDRTIDCILGQPDMLTDDRIEDVFAAMSNYAKNYTPQPRGQSTILTFNDLVTKSREKYAEVTTKAEKAKRTIISGIIAGGLICVAISGVATNNINKNAQKRISECEKNAEKRISEYETKYLDMLDNFQTVDNSNVDVDLDIFDIRYEFRNSEAFKATDFYAQIIVADTLPTSRIEYGQAKLIVQLKDGTVKSYAVKDCSNDLRYISNWEGSGKPVLGPFHLASEEEDIQYIKIRDLVFYEDATASLNKKGHTIEIEVFVSEDT